MGAGHSVTTCSSAALPSVEGLKRSRGIESRYPPAAMVYPGDIFGEKEGLSEEVECERATTGLQVAVTRCRKAVNACQKERFVGDWKNRVHCQVCMLCLWQGSVRGWQDLAILGKGCGVSHRKKHDECQDIAMTSKPDTKNLIGEKTTQIMLD